MSGSAKALFCKIVLPFGNATNRKSVRREWDVCQVEGDVSLHKVELLYLLVRLDVLESEVSRQVDDLDQFRGRVALQIWLQYSGRLHLYFLTYLHRFMVGDRRCSIPDRHSWII